MSSDPIAEVGALSAAEALAHAEGLALVGAPIDGDAEPERCRFPIYILPDGYPVGWWVILAIDENPDALRSSRVIGVSKTTGEARLLGDAGDEG